LLSVVLADSKLWKEEDLSKHASLFATWLLEIGHRGVFAHVVCFGFPCVKTPKLTGSPIVSSIWQTLRDPTTLEGRDIQPSGSLAAGKQSGACLDAPSLMKRHYQRHLSDIVDVERPSKRRSAGLPYLLLGALSGFSTHNPAQQHAFQRLFDSLSPESPVSDVTKTHVIHSLRVLLQDGKMSIATKPHVQKAFSVSIAGFGSNQ
jgi:hypothetical protein